jgi:hypothetical protein
MAADWNAANVFPDAGALMDLMVMK